MLDNFRKTQVIWDRASQQIQEFTRASSSDNHGRKLSVTVTDEGREVNLTGSTLSLYWEATDKTGLGTDYTVQGLDYFVPVDISKGQFEMYYTPELLSNVGYLKANLVLIGSSGRIVSEAFRITVFKGIDEGAVVGQASFTALTEALAQVGELEEKYAPRLNAVEINKADKTEVNNLTAQLAQTVTHTELDAQLASLLDGGPSIFMDSLAVLQSTYPNGAAGVALVRETDPAKIYVWDGGTWKDFGDYQGIEVKDNTLTPNKFSEELLEYIFTNFKNLHHNINYSTINITQSVGYMHTKQDGKWTIFNTFYDDYQALDISQGHKYYIRAVVSQDSVGKISDRCGLLYSDGTFLASGTATVAPSNRKTHKIITATKSGKANAVFSPLILGVCSRESQLVIDLTLIFGSGNEPSTPLEVESYINTFIKFSSDGKATRLLDQFVVDYLENKNKVLSDLNLLSSKVDLMNSNKYLPTGNLQTFYRETDKELLWYDKSRKLLYALDATDIAKPNAPGQEKRTLYRSENFGLSWQAVYVSEVSIRRFKTLESGYHIIRRNDSALVRVSPDFSSESVWAGGVSSPVDSELGIAEHNGVIIYAEYGTARQYRLLRSIDDGITWTVSHDGSDVRHWHSVQIDPYTGYFWACAGDSDTESRILCSEDNGVTWIVKAVGSQRERAVGLVFFKDFILWAMDTAGAKPYIVRANKDNFVPTLVGEVPLGTTTLGVSKTIDGLAIGWTRVETNSAQRESCLIWTTDGTSIQIIQKFAIKTEHVLGTGSFGFTLASAVDNENRIFLQGEGTIMDGLLGLVLPIGIF